MKVKWIRRGVVVLEALLTGALLVLSRFAYFRAGVNHHAKFQRMVFLRDYMSGSKWLLWFAAAAFFAVLFLRMKRAPKWYRAIGLFLALSLMLLLLPGARTITIYSYVFLVNAGALVLHALGGIAPLAKREGA